MPAIRLRMPNVSISQVIGGLWTLYRAGAMSYSHLQSTLKKSPAEQRKVYNRYKYKKAKGFKKAKPKSDIPVIKKQLRDINRRLNNDLSLRTYRQRDTSFEGAGVNTKEGLPLTGLDTTLIESAISNLRYWSESTGAYVDATPTTGASNEITIKKFTSRVVLRNNYQVPCMVEFYICLCKDDTSINPYTAYTNGLADQDNPSASSPLMYLTDSDQFNDLWKIKRSLKKELRPGQECSLTYSVNKPFQYDPSLVDSHTMAYQRKYHGHSYVVRTLGVLSHDSVVNTERGFAQSGVDIYKDLTLVVEYESGGPSLNDFVVVDNSNSFTNGAVCSNNPVVDNQAYSLA